eukprot:6990804-Karenia_brevis.AAC.1
MRVCPGRDDDGGACDIPDDEGERIVLAGNSLQLVSQMRILGCIVSANATSGDEIDSKVAK